MSSATGTGSVPVRRARVQRWNPLSLGFCCALVGLVVALAFVPVVMSENAMQKLTTLYILVIMAAMWNALAGYGGLVSVGQQAFIGIAAYGAIFLGHQHTVEPFLAMLLAALIAGVIAIPVGLIVLNLRGGAFAIGTWVIAEIFAILVAFDSKLGAGTGISFLELNFFTPRHLLEYTYWSALGSTAVLLLILFILLRTRLGASLQAIRDDEGAAASVGTRVMLGKGILFVLAGLGCGAAGALTLANQLFIQPDSIFSVNYSALMIFMVLVGGIGTFEGPIIGAIVLFVIQNEVGDHWWYYTLLGSVAIAFALFLPRGLWGTVVDRYNVRLLPVGYRLRLLGGPALAKSEEPEPAAD
ncbi:MAG TPA: branched-chain amino acid ABC transporter permease [Gaiellaceae bacterium]|nr:branched-chain amino acid ABC transporter permease [Gaiellaceae bacterium]